MRLVQFLLPGSFVLCLVLACAVSGDLWSGSPPGRDLPFDGPGRLAVVFERGADGARERTLVLYSKAGRRVVPGVQPEEVRWLSAHELLLMVPDSRARTPRSESDWLPSSELRLVDLEGNILARIGTVRSQYDPEPSPDGAFLALRVDVDGRGESDLEIWSLRGDTGRLWRVRRPLEAPRWSPEGTRLVAAELRQDSEPDSSSAGFAGIVLPFPRLVVFRPDLSGPFTELEDGRQGRRRLAGGTVPLWWDHEGIWARQRTGLVRCQPEPGGCAPVYPLPVEAPIVGGRRIGAGVALLLVRRGSRMPGVLGNEIHRVALDTREGALLWRAPRGLAIADLDWVADPEN